MGDIVIEQLLLVTHPITAAMISGLAALSGTSMVMAENTLTTSINAFLSNQ